MGKNRVGWSHELDKVSHYGAVGELCREPLQPAASAIRILHRGFRQVCRVETSRQDTGEPNKERQSEPPPGLPLLPRLAGSSCPSLTPLPPPLPSNTPVLIPVVLPMVPEGLHGTKANQFPSSPYRQRTAHTLPETQATRPSGVPTPHLPPPKALPLLFLGGGAAVVGAAQALTWGGGHSRSEEHLALVISPAPLFPFTLVCSSPPLSSRLTQPHAGLTSSLGRLMERTSSPKCLKWRLGSQELFFPWPSEPNPSANPTATTSQVSLAHLSPQPHPTPTREPEGQI